MRSSILPTAVLAALVLCASVQYAIAQDDETEDLEISPPHIPTDDVDFTHYFPNNPFKTLMPGHATECLIGIRNRGIKNETYTVFGLTGRLVNPLDFAHVVRNLTAFRYIVSLAPHEEATLPYTVKVDLDPMEVGMVVVVDYIDSAENRFRGLGVSDIVTISSPLATLDLQALSVYLLLLVFAIGVAYFTYTTFLAQYLPKPALSASGKRRATVTAIRPSEAASSGSGDENAPVLSPASPASAGNLDMDWIPDHVKAAASPASSKGKRRK
ncbi:hypothetical protein SeMB42_g03438 [Synchytrium endobioticum]|uniref:Uncharacterized protein n=1 Tax=Synchytrium endobioticum TaxID=286115 RepID=A0A507D161_9FUNG|nr:hypothetical protein SeLEV6574_g04069 [Synchytrium endobioticum]TPX47133.1 hypothetical protein SeMB42_g03438 [Synchytrium endobioticum]